jgi:hypothetical protein
MRLIPKCGEQRGSNIRPNTEMGEIEKLKKMAAILKWRFL